MLLFHVAWTTMLALVIDPPPASPQTIATRSLTYDVVVHDQAIGRLKVNKTASPAGTQYLVDADVSMHFFGPKRMVTRFTSTYQSNLLTEASFHDQMNGRTRHDSRVRWDGKAYQIQVNKAESVIPTRRASFSTATLYDREPLGISELFSERHGRFCALRQVVPHTYELTLPDGKKNYYRYVDGVCREVEVRQPFFTIYFRLRHE